MAANTSFVIKAQFLDMNLVEELSSDNSVLYNLDYTYNPG